MLKPALYFAGIIVDEQGRPIPGTKIIAGLNFDRSSAGVETTASESDGSFELFSYPMKPNIRPGEVARANVFFFHPDYVDRRIEDLYALAPDQRESLRVVLEAGHRVAGTVIDADGRPVPDAAISASREDGAHRKWTRTDVNGKFSLRGLSEGPMRLSARALDIKQKTHLTMALEALC